MAGLSAAVAGVFDLAYHRTGLASWIAIFGFVLRSKFLLAERLPRALPQWLAFAIPSAIIWAVLALAMQHCAGNERL